MFTSAAASIGGESTMTEIEVFFASADDGLQLSGIQDFSGVGYSGPGWYEVQIQTTQRIMLSSMSTSPRNTALKLLGNCRWPSPKTFADIRSSQVRIDEQHFLSCLF